MAGNTQIIRTEIGRGILIRIIQLLNLSKSNGWEVTIKPHVKRRTDSQNRLMWRWVDNVAEHVVQHTGQDSEDVHEFFKRKFLTPRRFEIEGEMIEVWSTKKLTTKEMSEYMERIYAWATSELGLLLPLPSELGRDETGRAT